MNKFVKCSNVFTFEVSLKIRNLVHLQGMSSLNKSDSNSSDKVDSNTIRAHASNIALPQSSDLNLPIYINSEVERFTRGQYSYPYFYCGNFNYPFHYTHYAPFFPYNFNRHTQFSCRSRNFHHGIITEKMWTWDDFGSNMPALRSWDKMSENTMSTTGFVFTIMSYNVLAQDLLEQLPYLYKNHDKESLSWSIRWDNLYREITMFHPDILCLQEVQESHMDRYFSLLENLGYEGVYKKRTGIRVDGCAIYYKANIIKLIDHTAIEFFQPSVNLLNRDNVALIMKFAPKSNITKEFVVATTHLLYNPRRDDVRMAQMQLLLTDLEKMSYKSGKKPYYLPTILTGDLNSSPTSDLYKFIMQGCISYNDLAPKMLEEHNSQILVTHSLGITDNCQHAELVNKRKDGNTNVTIDNNKSNENSCKEKLLSHNFKFKSVYNHGTRLSPEGTTHQNKWLTVDYIFYSKGNETGIQEHKLKLLSRYRLPTSQELNGVTIPNQILGSDHLSLMAQFKLIF